MNDLYIFVHKSFPILQQMQDQYEISTHKKDRRYYVPTRGRKKFARRKDKEIREIYSRFLSRELFENLIVTAISQFESFLFVVLRLVFLKYPKKLTINIRGIDTEKGIPLAILLDTENRAEALEKVIERQLNGLSYAPPSAYLDYVKRVCGVDTSDPAFVDYIELKASRDLIIHNSGIINASYLLKAGVEKRGNVGEKIAVNESYFDHCLATLKRLSGIIRRDIDKHFPGEEGWRVGTYQAACNDRHQLGFCTESIVKSHCQQRASWHSEAGCGNLE
jgi:hypothetical protein